MPPIGAVRFRPILRLGVEHARPAELFRVGFVAGRFDELLELRDRHFVAIDPEWFQRDIVGRGFIRIAVVGSHAKRPAGQKNHLCWSGGRRGMRAFLAPGEASEA